MYGARSLVEKPPNFTADCVTVGGPQFVSRQGGGDVKICVCH